MTLTNANAGANQKVRPWHGGLVLMALGAALIIIGALQTTTSNPNFDCPNGSVLIAKFNVDHGHYVFEKPAGNAGIVTITNGSRTGGDASSTKPFSAIIVKGGDAAVMTTFSPPQTTAHFSNAGLPRVGSGNIPDISNVQFCGSGNTSPTTTVGPSTTAAATTTAAPTTTAAAPTTTAASTTTVSGSTTTVSGTTTTVSGSTTTSSGTVVVTTTQPPATTAAPTTTEPQRQTSTVAPPPVVTSTTVLSAVLGELPSTGSPSVPLIILGIVLVLAGVTLSVIGRARDRRVAS